MTTAQKPEAGEVQRPMIEFRHNGRLGRVDIHWADGDTVATPEDLAAASFVPASSLAAAEKRVAELTEELEAEKRRTFAKLNDADARHTRSEDGYEKQLASERAGREHLEEAAELVRRSVKFHYEDGASPPEAGQELLRSQQAWFVRDQSSTPASPSEGPASPVAEGERARLTGFQCPKCGSPYFASGSKADGTLTRYCRGNHIPGTRNDYEGCDYAWESTYDEAHGLRNNKDPQKPLDALRSQPTPTGEAKDHVGIQKDSPSDSHRGANGGAGGLRANKLPQAETVPSVQPVSGAAADRGRVNTIAYCRVKVSQNGAYADCGSEMPCGHHPVAPAAEGERGSYEHDAAREFRKRLVRLLSEPEPIKGHSLYCAVLGLVYLGAGEGSEDETALEDAFARQSRGEGGEAVADDAEKEQEFASRLLEYLTEPLESFEPPPPQPPPLGQGPTEALTRGELVEVLRNVRHRMGHSWEAFEVLADELAKGKP